MQSKIRVLQKEYDADLISYHTVPYSEEVDFIISDNKTKYVLQVFRNKDSLFAKDKNGIKEKGVLKFTPNNIFEILEHLFFTKKKDQNNSQDKGISYSFSFGTNDKSKQKEQRDNFRVKRPRVECIFSNCNAI